MTRAPEREVRALGELHVERRQDTGLPRLTGYAAVFDAEANIGGMFRERVARGAFAQTIREDDIRALIDHQPSLIIGRNRAGTLATREDSRGLFVEIDPPDTQIARDLIANIEAGNVNQMSFAFSAVREEWDDSGRLPSRTLLEVRLFDVSAVSYAAYEQTSISAAARNRASRSRNTAAALRRRMAKRLERLEKGLRA